MTAPSKTSTFESIHGRVPSRNAFKSRCLRWSCSTTVEKTSRDSSTALRRDIFVDLFMTAPSETPTFERISGSGGLRGSGKLWASLGELWEGLEEFWEALYIDKLPIDRPSGCYVNMTLVGYYKAKMVLHRACWKRPGDFWTARDGWLC